MAWAAILAKPSLTDAKETLWRGSTILNIPSEALRVINTTSAILPQAKSRKQCRRIGEAVDRRRGLQDLSELQQLLGADVTTLLQDVPPPQSTTHALQSAEGFTSQSTPPQQFQSQSCLPDMCTLGLLQPAAIAIVMASYTS